MVNATGAVDRRLFSVDRSGRKRSRDGGLTGNRTRVQGFAVQKGLNDFNDRKSKWPRHVLNGINDLRVVCKVNLTSF